MPTTCLVGAGRSRGEHHEPRLSAESGTSGCPSLAMVQRLSDLPGLKIHSPPFCLREAPVAWDVAAPSQPLDV